MENLVGNKFGRLTVVKLSNKTWKDGQKLWYCVCDCGGHTYTSTGTLNSGHTKSCGCLNKQRLLESLTTHGKAGTPIYNTWAGLIQRCHNINNSSYERYGGRGIFVCRRWRKSFENFYKDMGERPSDLTIERVDNNGPYGPWNCKWATIDEQVRNRRSNIWIQYKGKNKVLCDWADELGINRLTLKSRLDRGWDIESAFEKDPKKPKFIYEGESLTLSELARRVKININTLYKRLHGLQWPLEKAISTPINKFCRNKKVKNP